MQENWLCSDEYPHSSTLCQMSLHMDWVQTQSIHAASLSRHRSSSLSKQIVRTWKKAQRSHLSFMPKRSITIHISGNKNFCNEIDEN
jgi:hypothetical protein